MFASIKVFTWFRIPVYIHWSFSLILIWIGWYGNQHEMSVMDMFWQLLVMIALFACVLLHEFGHSLMARRYGVETQDIILTPIGGIARLERMPEKPAQELLVAVAGPMVNVVIVALLYILCKFVLFTGDIEWWYFKQSVLDMLSLSSETGEADLVIQESGITMPTWLFMFPLIMTINITMVLFNMIPAFPMDGGRVLRSLLAMRIGRVKATRIASYLGQFVAVVFVVYGLYNNQFMLALIGFFVFNTARQEELMVRTDHVVNRFTAKDVVRIQFSKLMANDWMQTPIQYYTQVLEKNFLVFDFHDQMVGYLDEASIIAAAKKKEVSAPVANYMKNPVEVIRDNESLRYVYHLLGQANKTILAVVDEEMRLIGVIDQDGLEKFMKINQG